MTVLALLRHAKAVRNDPAGDHARALSPAGREAAGRAGSRLAQHLPADALVIASDACRTRQTAALAFPSRPEGGLRLDPSLYLATSDALLAVVRALPAEVAAAVLVGHNPSISEFAARLAGAGTDADLARVAQGLATADAVVFSFPCRWTDIAPGSGRVSAMLAREPLDG